PPQMGISQGILHPDAHDIALETIINSWIRYHTELLSFYHQHKDKCILVNFEQCLANPNEFIALCQKSFAFNFNEKIITPTLKTNTLQSLETELFSVILKEYPQIDALYQELKASATLFPKLKQDEHLGSKEQTEILWNDYKKTVQAIKNDHFLQTQNIKELKALKIQMATVTEQAKASEKAQIIQLQALEKQKSDDHDATQTTIKALEAEKDSLNEQKEHEKITLQNKLKDAQEKVNTSESENELMLSQLHQVQEDLEAQFLKSQSLEKQKSNDHNATQATIKALEAEKDSLNEQKEHEKITLQNKLKDAQEKVNTSESENELMLLQLHQVQEELEAQFLTSQSLEKQKTALNKEVEQKTKALDTEKIVLNKQKETEKTALQSKVNEYQEKAKEAESENELMLLQLHQTQEELEAQFLKSQSLEKQKSNDHNTAQEKIKALESKKTALEKQKIDRNKETEQRIKILNSEKDSLNKQKEHEKNTLQNKLKDAQETVKESESENELMLLQLHQVQEELEHYFLKYQALENSTQDKPILSLITSKPNNTIVQAQVIQAEPSTFGLTIEFINLQSSMQLWKNYQLTLIKPTSVYDETTLAAIKLPLQKNNLLPLQTWPPQTADEHGAYWLIDQSLLEKELIHSSLHPEDIYFLHHLVQNLSLWLKELAENSSLQNNNWDDYYDFLNDMEVTLSSIAKSHQR
ncbi:MAG: hypothetical protein KAU26_04955, partial [Methylococcales bacterium]|nr:hypothetical protein [Methylococcales bacterium]